MDTQLQALRDRLRGNVSEDGIYLVYRSRYQESARDVAQMVRDLNGFVELVQKTGKMTSTTHKGKYGPYNTFSKPWRVVFSVGIDEDLYLAGRINLPAMKSLEATLGPAPDKRAQA